MYKSAAWTKYVWCQTPRYIPVVAIAANHQASLIQCVWKFNQPASLTEASCRIVDLLVVTNAYHTCGNCSESRMRSSCDVAFITDGLPLCKHHIVLPAKFIKTGARVYLLHMKLRSIANYRYLMPLHQHHMPADHLLKISGCGWLLHIGYCEVYRHTFRLLFGLLEPKFFEYSFSWIKSAREQKFLECLL